jgi:hypothetical protein
VVLTTRSLVTCRILMENGTHMRHSTYAHPSLCPKYILLGTKRNVHRLVMQRLGLHWRFPDPRACWS